MPSYPLFILMFCGRLLVAFMMRTQENIFKFIA